MVSHQQSTVSYEWSESGKVLSAESLNYERTEWCYAAE